MFIRIYIDEAGRGPLAGPLFVGTIMQIGNISKKDLSEFKDSKILLEKERELLFEKIKRLEKTNKIIYSIGIAEVKEIDIFGITKSINLAITRALFSLFGKFYHKKLKKILKNSQFGKDLIKTFEIEKILTKEKLTYEDVKKLKELLFSENKDYTSINLKNLPLPVHYKLQAILIDGKTDFGIFKNLGIRTITIIDGDAKIPQISMASILAKVSRDNFMKILAKKYPQYGLEKHKGYRNHLHIENIKKFGISDIHRKRFLINLAKDIEKKSNKTEIEKKIIKEINNFKNDFLDNLFGLSQKKCTKIPTKIFNGPILINKIQNINIGKKGLLLHVCCAPDLTWPLRWLKNYFKLYLFWYNPNIHPIDEHKKRYDQYIKFLELEKGDYEIIEDWYNPKEFFDYLYMKIAKNYSKILSENKLKTSKNIIQNISKDKYKKQFFKKLAEMEEKNSDRCWWCYELRMAETAKIAEKYKVPYFTSTLLISPKKDLTHLFLAGLKAQHSINNRSKFLFFDFKKDGGFQKALQICREYNIRRQNYCGCVRSVR